MWQCLVSQGMTLDKYNKDWKKKSYFLIGKAELGLGNYQSALDNLKAALALIEKDPALVKQNDELRTLITQATTKLKAENKKQRDTWSKAFEKGKKEEMYSDPVSPAPSPKKTESTNSFSAGANGSAGGAAAAGAAAEDAEVAKIIQGAIGGKGSKVSPATASVGKTATDGSALWVPDTLSLALVMGSIFVALGGWYFWGWSRRRW